MALPGNEKLYFLEQEVGAVAVEQAQQEGIEQTISRLEAQRILEGDEIMMQLQREIVIVSKFVSTLITPVSLRGEEEISNPENTSMEEYTLQ
jgi:hypothetical protein